MDIETYIEICKFNEKNILEYDLPWEENNVTNELVYIFQDKGIFKKFLNSIGVGNVDKLKFKKYNTPKTGIKIKIDGKKREIDFLYEGENFICLIENKFRSNEKNNQCEAYRAYIKEKYKNIDYKIFIYLDNEGSSKKVNETEFKSNKCYEEYKLGLYGKNLLPILEEVIDNNGETILPTDETSELTKFCRFLQEIVYCTINKNIITYKKEIIEKIKNYIEKEFKVKVRHNKEYDEIQLGEKNDYFLSGRQCLILSDEEIIEKLRKKLETVGWVKPNKINKLNSIY